MNSSSNFCKIVASGNHHSLHNASDELLNYLFSFQTSFSVDDFYKISEICFVRPDPLPRLSWIKTPCAPVNSTLQLTTLRGAAVSSRDNLVWTVMPVVKVPWNQWLTEKHLGMITQPSGEDVYNNVLSISKAALADFKLFSTYDLKDAWETGKTDIVSVMSANLMDLFETYVDKLKDLANVACIPVVADVTKPEHTYVLVNSLQVVWSMDASEKCLEPYINELPSGMHTASLALEKIGVTQLIGIKHLEYILQCIHHQIGGRKIHQNQLLKVRTAILKIMNICDHDFKQRDALTELYLSCNELTLVKSTHLLVDDSQRYGDALDFSSSSYKMFVLPPDTSSECCELSLDLKSEASLCLSLRERLRPKRISVCLLEINEKDVKICETPSDLCEQLSHMIQFHKKIRLVLSQSNEGVLEPELREAIANNIAAIIEQVKVQTVSSLRTELFLTLNSPPSYLGSKPVPFLLSQTQHGSYCLSVDSMESVSRHISKFWSELSHRLCIEAAKVGNFSPEDCLLFRTCLSELLQVKSDSDMEYVASKFSVILGDIDTPFDVPKLGQPLQRCDCHQDINNIFRAQEWVGYEYKEDHFIYAIVLHPMLPGKATEYLQRLYKIKFGVKEEDWKEVSALDLYKLIDDAEEHVEQRVQATSSRGLVLYTGRRSASTTSTRTKKPLSKNEKLLELKKNIYKDLTTVQNLPKESRNKALKRLYFKYHPDKAEPEEADIYDDAFKYLMKQIDNLKAGLNLDDPETKSKPSQHTSAQWTNYRAWNETARNMYRRRKRRSRSKRRRPRYTQPAPDNVEAKRWLRQAEADCCSLRVLKRSVVNETKTASTLCFLAHQVVEKALKACTYQLFGLDQSCLQQHQLVCLADAIHSNKCSSQTKKLCKIASSLEHHYLKSQYPNAHQSPTAPVDVYNAVEAKECAEAAETALKIVQNLMIV